MYNTALWGVFMAYLERRSVQGCPKSLRLPEATMRWERIGGILIGTPGFCLTPSTSPPEPGQLEEFGAAWLQMAEDQRLMLLDCVVLTHQPWLRGRLWKRRLRQWRLSPRRYERLLAHAWRGLTRRYYRRREAAA
jgi:hypothetical protein